MCALWLAATLPVTADAPQPARAKSGMVASAERQASEIGVAVLKRGGNAVDAAVAVAFALAVTFPEAGNLGGGGFMLIRLKDGQTTALDYREVAPAAATRDLYIAPDGGVIAGEGSSTVGYRAAGVPGTVAGLARAHRKYGSGKLSWWDLIEPARRLADKGFPVPHSLVRSLGAEKARALLARYPESRRLFQRDGRPYAEGEIFRQPELAGTLRRLQRQGPREFYEGETARRIADDMARNHGLITLADLRAYAPKERAPLRGTYRGYGIVSMPPPSSGGAVLIEMLNILEHYDLGAMGVASSERYHHLVEAMRRGFADRSEYFGDPDFVTVPLDRLTAKSHAARQRGSIHPEQASRSADVRPGLPAADLESPQTTHFTVVDKDGAAVANTYTLNGAYGSGVVAKGTGVLLNNEMDDFAAKPGVPNLFGLIQGEKNAIAPGKRPLSSMTPTFVLRKDGTLWFTIGSPGGPTIINTVLQVITNIVDQGMNLRQAIDAPRIHHQWLPDEITREPGGLSTDTQAALAARGHAFAARIRYLGDAQGIMIEEKTGMRLGASDPRGDGAAAGY